MKSGLKNQIQVYRYDDKLKNGNILSLDHTFETDYDENSILCHCLCCGLIINRPIVCALTEKDVLLLEVDVSTSGGMVHLFVNISYLDSCLFTRML